MIPESFAHICWFFWLREEWVWLGDKNPTCVLGSCCNWKFIWTLWSLQHLCVPQEWELLSGFCGVCTWRPVRLCEWERWENLASGKPPNRRLVPLLLRSPLSSWKSRGSVPNRVFPKCPHGHLEIHIPIHVRGQAVSWLEKPVHSGRAPSSPYCPVWMLVTVTWVAVHGVLGLWPRLSLMNTLILLSLELKTQFLQDTFS